GAGDDPVDRSPDLLPLAPALRRGGRRRHGVPVQGPEGQRPDPRRPLRAQDPPGGRDPGHRPRPEGRRGQGERLRAVKGAVPLSFSLLANCGAARYGRLTTAHGVVETPAFLPVGTLGAVKGVTPQELEAAGASILLANLYHLS